MASEAAHDSMHRVRASDRNTAPLIRERLREDILGGRIEPGAEMSQAQVAATFGVSRAPVREAFRLLERDGLLEARMNHRARVAGLSVDDLEHLYALRVVNESLALQVSVGRFDEAELDELDELGARLREPDSASFDFETWDALHQRFHLLLLTHSGSRMLESAGEWAARTQRYRRAYAEDAGGLPAGAAEHTQLAATCRAGDAPAAARLLTRHLSRAALTLLAQMAPEHEPVLLRTAIRQVLGQDHASRSSLE